MSFLSAFLNATNFKTPFLRTLLPTIGLAYGLQAAVAIPSIFAQSERFYDLSGSLTYLSCTALSLYLPTLRARAAATLHGTALPAWPSLIASLTGQSAANAWNWRQVVLSAAVSIWAARRRSLRVESTLPITDNHHQSAASSSSASAAKAATRASTASGPRRPNSSAPSSRKRHGYHCA